MHTFLSLVDYSYLKFLILNLRWYLQRVKDLAEKTDTGRVTAPSILRLLETSLMQESGSDTSGRSIAELWDGADKVLEVIFLFSFMYHHYLILCVLFFTELWFLVCGLFSELLLLIRDCLLM